MVSKTLALVLAISSAVSAAPALQPRQDKCQDAYKACSAAGIKAIVCECSLTACLGEDSARNRAYCFTATAGLPQFTPSPTTIPGGLGCNPAHPGSCPPSYFSSLSAQLAATPIPTSIPGGCNPAHPGSCPESYFSTAGVTPVATSIPGGCNPAHPGSCPTATSTFTPALPTHTGKAGPNPIKVEGKTWTIANLTRYCGDGNVGCDYNFAIEANGQVERCTIIRKPGSNAATESWNDQPCTQGSNTTVSWGYAAGAVPPFAVLTVVEAQELAWFGVSNVNGQEVTPNNPFGSGNYGTIGPLQVFSYYE
ncbi:uncharacterized protein K460DRAFT_367193 [Cucurbitaria berberidis CBS 394.84]|uniref:Extracellular membrane protein CFEM domain-containing protein n=1 Tax=Cucurbitaria berberidis CBS 394.84 TaxID=1168544 RepID=A0A9P4GJ38_9PLEO|nr:uncharacterized protein K460DRAFT_367193 [Cucurbitaria berberidis CBS 394.84]KAF1846389.1 hypothetical protein K460DRAFT_367193 [Cucurbitaria berberidis CBS 394.84]